eukprot:403357706
MSNYNSPRKKHVDQGNLFDSPVSNRTKIYALDLISEHSHGLSPQLQHSLYYQNINDQFNGNTRNQQQQFSSRKQTISIKKRISKQQVLQMNNSQVGGWWNSQNHQQHQKQQNNKIISNLNNNQFQLQLIKPLDVLQERRKSKQFRSDINETENIQSEIQTPIINDEVAAHDKTQNKKINSILSSTSKKYQYNRNQSHAQPYKMGTGIIEMIQMDQQLKDQQIVGQVSNFDQQLYKNENQVRLANHSAQSSVISVDRSSNTTSIFTNNGQKTIRQKQLQASYEKRSKLKLPQLKQIRQEIKIVENSLINPQDPEFTSLTGNNISLNMNQDTARKLTALKAKTQQMNQSFYVGQQNIKDLYTKRKLKELDTKPVDLSYMAERNKSFLTRNIARNFLIEPRTQQNQNLNKPIMYYDPSITTPTPKEQVNTISHENNSPIILDPNFQQIIQMNTLNFSLGAAKSHEQKLIKHKTNKFRQNKLDSLSFDSRNLTLTSLDKKRLSSILENQILNKEQLQGKQHQTITVSKQLKNQGTSNQQQALQQQTSPRQVNVQYTMNNSSYINSTKNNSKLKHIKVDGLEMQKQLKQRSPRTNKQGKTFKNQSIMHSRYLSENIKQMKLNQLERNQFVQQEIQTDSSRQSVERIEIAQKFKIKPSQFDKNRNQKGLSIDGNQNDQIGTYRLTQTLLVKINSPIDYRQYNTNSNITIKNKQSKKQGSQDSSSKYNQNESQFRLGEEIDSRKQTLEIDKLQQMMINGSPKSLHFQKDSQIFLQNRKHASFKISPLKQDAEIQLQTEYDDAKYQHLQMKKVKKSSDLQNIIIAESQATHYANDDQLNNSSKFQSQVISRRETNTQVNSTLYQGSPSRNISKFQQQIDYQESEKIQSQEQNQSIQFNFKKAITTPSQQLENQDKKKQIFQGLIEQYKNQIEQWGNFEKMWQLWIEQKSLAITWPLNSQLLLIHMMLLQTNLNNLTMSPIKKKTLQNGYQQAEERLNLLLKYAKNPNEKSNLLQMKQELHEFYQFLSSN